MARDWTESGGEYGKTGVVDRSTSMPRCCLCRESVESNGYCLSCQRWPINVVPVRLCRCGTRVDPDGWCRRCILFTATRLDPRAAEWVDTGKVSKLIDRESNRERMRGLVAVVERSLLQQQPRHRDLEREKRTILAMNNGAETTKGDKHGGGDRPAGDSGPSAGILSDEVPF